MLKIINYQNADKHHSGNIYVLEGRNKIKFKIKRIYFINNIKNKHTRPGHAHKKLQQIISCIAGSVKIKIFDGKNHKIISLKNPKKAIYLKKGLWREITFMKKGSILLVICSDIYKANDYIRSLKKYIIWKKSNT